MATVVAVMVTTGVIGSGVVSAALPVPVAGADGGEDVAVTAGERTGRRTGDRASAWLPPWGFKSAWGLTNNPGVVQHAEMRFCC